MLKKIKLLGHLGKKFGKEYLFDVASPAEAVKALCHQVKGFKQYMQEGSGRDQKFKIVVGKEVLSDIPKQIHMETDNNISIVPVVKGAGGKVAGVALIIIGAALTYLSLGTAGAQGYALMAAGVALIAGGVIALTTKTPAGTAPSETNKDNDRSYLFNGAVNTTQQGQPIPIGYGRMRIGSQVVSASLSTTQIAI